MNKKIIEKLAQQIFEYEDDFRYPENQKLIFEVKIQRNRKIKSLKLIIISCHMTLNNNPNNLNPKQQCLNLNNLLIQFYIYIECIIYVYIYISYSWRRYLFSMINY